MVRSLGDVRRFGDGFEGFLFQEWGGGDAHKFAALVLVLDEVELRGFRFDNE